MWVSRILKILLYLWSILAFRPFPTIVTKGCHTKRALVYFTYSWQATEVLIIVLDRSCCCCRLWFSANSFFSCDSDMVVRGSEVVQEQVRVQGMEGWKGCGEAQGRVKPNRYCRRKSASRARVPFLENLCSLRNFGVIPLLQRSLIGSVRHPKGSQ